MRLLAHSKCPFGRRSVLTAASTVLLAAGAGAISGSRPSADTPPAAFHPDAALLNACASWGALLGRFGALCEADEDAPGFERHIRGAMIEGEALLVRLEGLRATTADGIHARAANVCAVNPDWAHSFDGPHGWPYRALACLLRDVAAMQVAGCVA